MQKNILILLLLISLCVGGCASPKLLGKFDGKTYVSPQMDYSVPIPVTSEGGRVSGDDERGVTFRDDMGMRVSFYSMQIEPGSQTMTTLQTGGHRPALEQYLKLLYHGVEQLNYHPDICDGVVSLVCSKDGVNKTSAAAFVHKNKVYLVEFDLPAATKTLWHGTEQEQIQWLEKQSVELAQTIQTK